MTARPQCCRECAWYEEKNPPRVQRNGAKCTWTAVFVVCDALKPYMPLPHSRMFVWRTDGTSCPTFKRKGPSDDRAN